MSTKKNEPYLNARVHGGDVYRILDYVTMLLDEIKKSEQGDFFDFTVKLELKGNILENAEKNAKQKQV